MPSANPDNASRCVPAWRDLGYRVAVLEDRTPIPAACDAKLTRAAYPGWGASINALFRETVPASCPVVVGGGDDLFPDPNRRAEVIAGEFLERFPDTLGVMQPTGDDFEATSSICGSPWIGRAWMERMYGGSGGICERYTQQYADEELFWVAKCADRLWLRPDLTQRHEHFRRLGQSAPLYWVESAAANEAEDCRVFIERSSAGFPGAAPVDTPELIDPRVFAEQYDGRAHRRYRSVLAPGGEHDEAARRLGEVFRLLEREGVKSVAVYGAGQHTHRAAAAFGDTCLRVESVIDDDPRRAGAHIRGVPVITRVQFLAASGGIDAVVLSSDTHEALLIERARPIVALGIRVVTLYSGQEFVPCAS